MTDLTPADLAGEMDRLEKEAASGPGHWDDDHQLVGWLLMRPAEQWAGRG